MMEALHASDSEAAFLISKAGTDRMTQDTDTVMCREA